MKAFVLLTLLVCAYAQLPGGWTPLSTDDEEVKRAATFSLANFPHERNVQYNDMTIKTVLGQVVAGYNYKFTMEFNEVTSTGETSMKIKAFEVVVFEDFDGDFTLNGFHMTALDTHSNCMSPSWRHRIFDDEDVSAVVDGIMADMRAALPAVTLTVVKREAVSSRPYIQAQNAACAINSAGEQYIIDLLIEGSDGRMIHRRFYSLRKMDGRITQLDEPFDLADNNVEANAPWCVVTGCSSELCAPEPRISVCSFDPSFECYRSAICSRTPEGTCRWRQTPELEQCLLHAKEKPSSVEAGSAASMRTDRVVNFLPVLLIAVAAIGVAIFAAALVANRRAERRRQFALIPLNSGAYEEFQVMPQV